VVTPVAANDVIEQRYAEQFSGCSEAARERDIAGDGVGSPEGWPKRPYIAPSEPVTPSSPLRDAPAAVQLPNAVLKP
jgi:hypothetical protein